MLFLGCSLLLLQVGADTELPTSDEDLEASIAAMVEGDDGEDITGRSGSSISSFRRLTTVCTDAAVSFREMAQSIDLKEVYSDFAARYRKKDGRRYFLYDKIVQSKWLIKFN